MRDYIPITNDVTEVARALKLTENGPGIWAGYAKRRADSVISDILARKRSGRREQYEPSNSSGPQRSSSPNQATFRDSIRRSCVKRSPFGSPFATLGPAEDDGPDDEETRQPPQESYLLLATK